VRVLTHVRETFTHWFHESILDVAPCCVCAKAILLLKALLLEISSNS